jgi:hypothetical protein
MGDKEMHIRFYGKEASWKTITLKTKKKRITARGILNMRL